MRNELTKVIQRVTGIFLPVPSFFDIYISCSLSINLFFYQFHKEIFFVFYTMSLLSLSIINKQQRNIRLPALYYILLWSLLSIFIHSYFINPGSFTSLYKNTYLMFEGFIYMFCGVMFLYLAINYSKNLKPLLFLLPILLVPWIKENSFRNTLPFAFLIGLLIYFIYRKKYLFASIILNTGLLFSFYKYHSIISNWQCRPFVFKTLLSQIKLHPFIGNGFNKTLNYDNMLFMPMQGWIFKHNDFLNITSCLGIVTLICLIWLIVGIAKIIKVKHSLLILLPIVLLCFFQMTMFNVDKAVSILLILGIVITVKFKEGIKC